MPYVTKPRPYKKEYQQQKARGEHETRMIRQTDRRDFDKADTGTMTKASPKRKGKHISHNASLAAAKGKKKKVAYKLEDPSTNMARNYKKKKKKPAAKKKAAPKKKK
jgi:hypothetical protein